MINHAAEDKILDLVFEVRCPLCGKLIPTEPNFSSRHVVARTRTSYKVICPSQTYGGKKK